MDWINLAQDRDQWRALVNMAMNLWVPQNFAIFLSSRATGGFSRRTQLYGVSQSVTCTTTVNRDNKSSSTAGMMTIFKRRVTVFIQEYVF
jgi:hypothetical protein